MNKKSKVAVAGVAAVALVGGTLAYWSSSSTINNPFSTNSYGGETTEEFNPADGGNWEPGSKVDKKVGVTNTGDYPIYVRMKFTETWSNLQSDVKEKANDAVNTMMLEQADSTDGKVLADKSVVEKKLVENWDSLWTKSDDGWYYFDDELNPNESTDNLLESVTLSDTTDMGKYDEIVTVTVRHKDGSEDWSATGNLKVEPVQQQDGSIWVYIRRSTDGGSTWEDAHVSKNPEDTITQSVKKVLKEGEGGYADADYVLTITSEYAQTDGCDWSFPVGTAGYDAQHPAEAGN